MPDRMHRTSRRPLTVRTETLRLLTTPDLLRVIGGRQGSNSESQTVGSCPSEYPCGGQTG